jgi:threonine aldolase
MKIDLRSDTVTKPTKEMLEAMFSAKVGDDVFNEDPTIIELEQKTAALFGKEAALFCPSGTMTNQIAMKAHTRPGDEIICDQTAHVYNYEGGGIGFNSGCSVRLLQGDKGRFTAGDVAENINPDNDVHRPLSRLVVIENTSNRGGGSIWVLGEIEKIKETCRKNGLALHLDGARLFNALVETSETEIQFGNLFDSISICLSKGLGAPVGSLLIGDKTFITQARRIRKVFGGGMRQAGYLAAAGIYALDHHISRLKEDHQRARHLGKLLEKLPFVTEVLPIQTNIVIFKLDEKMPAATFLKTLADSEVLAVPFGKQTIRFVTHLDFTDEMLMEVEKVFKKI